MNILILCTGNSARSQMAEGIIRSLDPRLEVVSAGTEPAGEVNPFAIQVMSEINIDIGSHFPKNVDSFLNDNFDYVITVCDHAHETCPNFYGIVKQKIHLGFEDPASVLGPVIEKLSAFRKIRDQIKVRFTSFYKETIAPQLEEGK